MMKYFERDVPITNSLLSAATKQQLFFSKTRRELPRQKQVEINNFSNKSVKILLKN